MNDLFNQPAPVTNTPEFSVSELSAAIKRTIESNFSYVRVRGELSKVTIAKSGHLYTTLKDDTAVLDGVCWKGTMAKLGIRPEEGLEVICTGRLTTYPGRSNYQLVIESMELAGMGAILKMLEARKAKLAAEGLFDPSRKKPLPYLPTTIGVVTSPTGAVIRDILHRLSDRFPVHVLVWPVVVQGERAAAEVINAINGFNDMDDDAPDLIIVARGGGSFEDLMPFNDEGVVRAVAASRVPLISAVGHETDVTLIDFAADVRAPTPTAAAEMAVPVRSELLALVLDDGQRLVQALSKRIDQSNLRLQSFTRTLERPERILESPTQHLDHAAFKITSVFQRQLGNAETRLHKSAGRLRTPDQVIAQKRQQLAHFFDRSRFVMDKRLSSAEHRVGRAAAHLRRPDDRLVQSENRLKNISERFDALPKTVLEKPQRELQLLSRMLESLSYHSVLERGFAIVQTADGAVVTDAAALKAGDDVSLTFAKGKAKARIS